MIKLKDLLKDLLKESSPGYENRQFGDPLPTLEDIKKNRKINEISDSANLWDSNGVEDRQAIMKALKKDSKIMKKIGPKPYWDDIDLVADNDDGDTVASLRRNMTLKDLKKAILKWRG